MYYGRKYLQPSPTEEVSKTKQVLTFVTCIFVLLILIVGIPIYVEGGTPLETYEATVMKKNQTESRGFTSSHLYLQIEGTQHYFSIGNTKYTTVEINDRIYVTKFGFFGDLISTYRLGTTEVMNQIVKVPSE